MVVSLWCLCHESGHDRCGGGCDRSSSEVLCRERQPHFLKCVDWFDELAIRIQSLGFLLDAIRHEVVPISIEIDAAHVQHCLSTLNPPAHARALHPVFDEMA